MPEVEYAADVLSSRCPSRSILLDLTGRWGALVLAALADGKPARFAAVRRLVDGISDRMLSTTLGNLERDGLVTRQVLSTIPPHVEYQLTELGRDVSTRLGALIDLVESSVATIMASRAAYDAKAEPSD